VQRIAPAGAVESRPPKAWKGTNRCGRLYIDAFKQMKVAGRLHKECDFLKKPLTFSFLHFQNFLLPNTLDACSAAFTDSPALNVPELQADAKRIYKRYTNYSTLFHPILRYNKAYLPMIFS
jgi:hypothetical protein